jgi:hypothetical protein
MPAYNTAQEKPHKGFLTTEEAGRVLGMGRRTVCYHIQKGHLTALAKRWKYGKVFIRTAYFIPIDEIKRFGMRKIVEKYAKPSGWVRATDDPAAILGGGA